ncbi:hypothetical protein KIPB_016612, partial [Kipferlia bialata]|eukprot:g16612.t1
MGRIAEAQYQLNDAINQLNSSMTKRKDEINTRMDSLSETLSTFVKPHTLEQIETMTRMR